MSKPNILFRLLSALWAGADGLRKVLHLVLLLFLFLLVIGMLSDAPPVLPERAALVIQPYGTLVEQLEGDPYDRAVAELLDDGRPQTLIQDIVDALEYARDDDRIDVVYLELSSVLGTGLAKLQRVAAAIQEFRNSGKPVIASADFMGQHAYYLAAHADEVWLHPDGALLIRGYGQFRTYYRDAIEMLRLDWNVFRVGTHKSFVEPFIRMDMSDEDREATSRLIEQLWGLYQVGVTMARDLDSDAIDDFAVNFVDHVAAAGGDTATAALDKGLVDELLTRNEARDRMIEKVGADPDRPDTFNAVGVREYLAQARLLSGGRVGERNVAVIVAAGDIFFGQSPPGGIGADSTAELFRRAANDETVEAIVVRIDSPGGSAFAAEVIADEIRALRAAGKPVVASMSSVAASGGYTIAASTDRIFASPATITGSIGVFGMFPTYQRTMAALGMNNDGVGTTPLSGQLRPDREMTEETRRLFQLLIEDTYDDFVSDVADSRGLDKETVDRIGQGQVWSGIDALNFGLVDELGTLEDAIAAAADLAGLAEGEYGTKLVEKELSAAEQLLLDLLTLFVSAGGDLSAAFPGPAPMESLTLDIRRKAETLLRFDDPQGIYRHCLCDSIR
ncbi:MAG: signal peptide peptidase SppA [Woeseiaceae bacterium]|nr:signal peptide peptidase SppA [Woeseiaceae bacterium]